MQMCSGKQWNYWKWQGAQCCQIRNGVSYQMLKIIVFWRIVIVHLVTLRGRSTNDSQKLSQKLQSETRARRWNVREIPFPKLVRAEKLVCERPRETQISDEAKSRTF